MSHYPFTLEPNSFESSQCPRPNSNFELGYLAKVDFTPLNHCHGSDNDPLSCRFLFVKRKAFSLVGLQFRRQLRLPFMDETSRRRFYKNPQSVHDRSSIRISSESVLLGIGIDRENNASAANFRLSRFKVTLRIRSPRSRKRADYFNSYKNS